MLKAAKDLNVNLAKSWMVGDCLTGIEAGKRAGCKTILIGRMKCKLCRLMDEKNTPDHIVKSLYNAVDIIKKEEVAMAGAHVTTGRSLREVKRGDTGYNMQWYIIGSMTALLTILALFRW